MPVVGTGHVTFKLSQFHGMLVEPALHTFASVCFGALLLRVTIQLAAVVWTYVQNLYVRKGPLKKFICCTFWVL